MPIPTKPFQPYADLHKKPKGPGDARPTALQVVEDEGLKSDGLKGKVFLVTGCSAGLGVETARALHATGADVFMAVREGKKEQSEKIVEDIKTSTKAAGKLELVFMDLSSFDSVRAGAADFRRRAPTLNVLVENAGVMMCPYSKTVDGWEMHMGTNHFGHFLLFQLLKDRLLAAATPEFSSRVVVVTSAGHRMSPVLFDDMNFERDGYDRKKGYGQSKTANIYMASSIERHYGSKHLHATSVHPGVILESELGRHQTADSINEDFDMKAMEPLGKSLSQGAATQVWAATSKHWNGRGGVYLGDLGEAGPVDETMHLAVPGYVDHTYDEEAEERLWRLSCDAVGVGYNLFTGG